MLRRKGNTPTLLVRMQFGAATMENNTERFLKKLKVELPYDIVIPFLGIYLKEIKALIQKDACTPMFIVALFTIAKIWKQQRNG